jgi:NCS1 family nucleobase:cation symporter-1
LGALFLVVTVYVLIHGHRLSGYHGGVHGVWAPFAIVVAATLSYLGSWSPYGSDYSRYLPARTSRRAIFGWAFLGGFLASAWLELLGVAVAVLAGSQAADPTAAAHFALGSLGDVAVVAIVLGGIAANAVNAYSNSLSAAAVGVSLPRWSLAIFASVVGLVASLLSSGHFEKDYENFLLLLGYWFAPWLGVQAVDFFVLRRRSSPARTLVSLPAMLAFLIGIGAEVPFMSSTLYTGPVASSADGADVSFYVGFLVAATAYLLTSLIARERPAPAPARELDEPMRAARAG